MNKENNKLLEINKLVTRYYTAEGSIKAVNGISYSLNRGEVLGVVGESGSGKSAHALSILKLIQKPFGEIIEGQVLFEKSNLLELSNREINRIRGKEIAMIFQDSMLSLNPVFTIGFQLMETIVLHLGFNSKKAKRRAIDLLKEVGIPDGEAQLHRYPHQFSGGMRQRIMIAMAISCNPKLLIADEPTTALDVTIQAQILDMMKGLQVRRNMAIIWISHDLGVISEISKNINVMYAGYIVERGMVKEILKKPYHPYTSALLRSIPKTKKGGESKLISIPGSPPNLLKIIPGAKCPFSSRCKYANSLCLEKNPELEKIDGENRYVACFHWKKIRSMCD